MDNQNNNKNNPRNNRQGWGVILFTTLLAVFIVMGLYSLMQDRDPEEISYDKFLEFVDDGKVEKVTIGTSRIYITLKEGVEKEEKGGEQSAQDEFLDMRDNLLNQMEDASGEDGDRERAPDYFTGTVKDDTLSERLYEADVEYGQEIPDTASVMMMEIFITVILPAAAGGAVQFSDASYVQGRRYDGNWKEQCEGVCRERDRGDVPGCGRAGRGKRIVAGSGGFPA